jgi:phenylacetate-CoA ligase
LIKHNIGVSVRVEVVPPAALERSIGKARRIVDNRPEPGPA